MCRVMFIKVFMSALTFLLLSALSQTGASRCTCPPHFFDEYANTRENANLVADGLLTQLLMIGSAESGNFLPNPPAEIEVVGYQAFRSALKAVAELHEKASTWDDLSNSGMINNQLMNTILNSLAGSACQWVSEVLPQNNDFNCSVDGLLHLNNRLHFFENVREADIATETFTTATEYGVTNTRCAWINYRLLDNCRPVDICSPNAPHTDTEKLAYYGSTFGCSGDFTLCSNI